MRVAWDGPSFARNLPHEAICDELCWSPTYSLAARISGSIDPDFAWNKSSGLAYDGFRSVVVRVTMEATIFIDVLKQVQIQSRGEAFICTKDGEVVAAVEMADTETADMTTGTVEMVKAWRFQRPWAPCLNEGMVMEGSGESKFCGDYLVSVWRLEGLLNATSTLGSSLRIVVAVPSRAFADSVLQSMRFWFIVTSAVPVVAIFFASLANLWLRFGGRGKKNFKDMSIAELKAINRTRRRMSSMRRSKSRLTISRTLSRGLSRTFSRNISEPTRQRSMMSNWLSRRQTKKHDANRMLADL